VGQSGWKEMGTIALLLPNKGKMDLGGGKGLQGILLTRILLPLVYNLLNQKGGRKKKVGE